MKGQVENELLKCIFFSLMIILKFHFLANLPQLLKFKLLSFYYSVQSFCFKTYPPTIIEEKCHLENKTAKYLAE